MNPDEYRQWAERMRRAGFTVYGREHNERMSAGYHEEVPTEAVLRGVVLVRHGFTWHLLDGDVSIQSSSFATPEARNALFQYAADNNLVIFEEVRV